MTDLFFLYLAVCAVSWSAYWMREWEERDHRRLQIDKVRQSFTHFRYLILDPLGEIERELDAAMGPVFDDALKLGKQSGPENWIPEKFRNDEYLINEIKNRAFIGALFNRKGEPDE